MTTAGTRPLSDLDFDISDESDMFSDGGGRRAAALNEEVPTRTLTQD
jgi:hypothetical protein